MYRTYFFVCGWVIFYFLKLMNTYISISKVLLFNSDIFPNSNLSAILFIIIKIIFFREYDMIWRLSPMFLTVINLLLTNIRKVKNAYFILFRWLDTVVIINQTFC